MEDELIVLIFLLAEIEDEAETNELGLCSMMKLSFLFAMSIFRRPLICQQFIFYYLLFVSVLYWILYPIPPGIGIFIFLESVLHQAFRNLSTKIKIKLEQVSGCWESSHNLERPTFVEARQSDTITFRKAINFMSSRWYSLSLGWRDSPARK